MSKFWTVWLAICLGCCVSAAFAEDSSDVTDPNLKSVPSIISPVESALPDSPGVFWTAPRFDDEHFDLGVASATSVTQSHAPTPANPLNEPYHWKGLLLQSFAFMMLEDGIRIMTADQDDRHLLLNKPYWSDYWASLQQFNMRRWNDGDSFPVNYVGHPMQGAIAGYIEEQNDPRGREVVISRDRRYWKSQWRAFLWSTVYSTQSEIGPFGEAAIFNEGGFTYPIHCNKGDTICQQPLKYTNNTGWVDFIITPTVGALWMIGEDTIDRFVSDPLVHKHPHALGYKVLRAGLNPPRSLANILRGHYPWFRDYEHPEITESPIVGYFDRAMQEEPKDHVDLFLHYTALALNINTQQCQGCRETTTGAGMEWDFAVRRYLDLFVDTSIQPGASPGSSLNIGGTLWTGYAGVRSGYSGKYFALKLSLAPGFASYSRTQPLPNPDGSLPPLCRNYNFSGELGLSADVRFTSHIALRVKTEQILIRYKSLDRDPPGIGTPPNLSFLSHDNYINSTNWGVNFGPVIRF
jgi:hypothetical protein